MDHYAELGVPRNADRATIKRAYRRKAQKAHPDKGGDSQRFHALQRAYNVLSDDARREAYDRTGEDGPRLDEEAMLLNAIAHMVLTAIDNVSVEHTDILALVREQLRGGRGAAEEAKRKHEHKIGAREKALKRLRRKDGSENVIAAMIEADIAANRRGIEMANAELQRIEKMLALVGQYEYKADGGGRPGISLAMWSTA